MPNRVYLALVCIPVLLVAGCGNQPPNSNQTAVTTTPKNYSKLTIDSVSTQNGNVIVKGSTDLPDGASVSVDFDVANTDKYYGSSKSVLVKDGHYEASITPHQWKQLQKGPYVITVDFFANTANQSDKILKLVGQHGEHLTGPLVKTEFGEKSLEVQKIVDLKLNITPAANGVSPSYLKSYLAFMNDYYHWMKQQIAQNPDPIVWGQYVTSHNRQGWDMYHKISYTHSEQEDPDFFQARNDVAQAWVFLTSLYQDYDSQINGTGSGGNTKDDEQQYLQMYEQASKEVQKLQ